MNKKHVCWYPFFPKRSRVSLRKRNLNWRKEKKKLIEYPNLEGALISKIYFAGHYMNAALCVFAALDLKEFLQSIRRINRPIKMILFVYGLPRIGNFKFAQYITSLSPSKNLQDNISFNIYRVTLENDILPQLPFLANFSTEFNPSERVHFGIEYWIQADCNCRGAQIVFRCMGEMGKSIKPRECNEKAVKNGLTTSIRYGPYLGYYMHKPSYA
ncbi:hypothetical protein G9A89_008915 [Geosiphon pyriformis]|nr:hypothetical protein G9A89_008915 [Geosiphon pyriformis]